MDRRRFLSTVAGAAIASRLPALPSFADPQKSRLKPMALGLLISPYDAPEATINRVRDMGFSNCFLSLDGYIGKFTLDAAKQIGGLLAKYELIATTVEVVGPEPLEWNFVQGPSTIGLVPPKTRAARIDALKQVSDFARLLGVSQVQTHCGFIPENPADALYSGSVEAIRTVAQHCQGNGQNFLMETGQETPTTMSRVIRDVNMSNLGVGLDTANLILYGKANPADAVEILGPRVRSVHAKDGKWPTDPNKLGEEVLIGQGLVDFKKVFTKLRDFGYTGAITIERETSGAQQIEDVKNEKLYLQRILDEVLC